MSAINIGASVAGRRIFAAGVAHIEQKRSALAEKFRRGEEIAKAERARRQAAEEARMADAAYAAEKRLRAIQARPTIRSILAAVCERHKVAPKAVLGQRRTHDLAVARQECWWLCREQTTLTFPQIGRFFDRDHTTVLYGIRAHEARMNGGKYDRVRKGKEARA